MSKKSVKVIFSVLMVMALFISACQPKPVPTPAAPTAQVPAGATEVPTAEAPAEPKPVERTTTKDTLVIGNINDVSSMDPYGVSALQRVRVTTQIYDTLFRLNLDGTYTPLLATEWEWKDDTHFVVKLRQGVKFHNGDDFNAEDLLFTIQFAAANQNWGVYFAKVDLANTKALDDFTVEIVFNATDAMAMESMANFLPIVNNTLLATDPAAMTNNAIGTGPYKFVNWITGDSVTLERFDDYWGDKAIIKTVVFRSIPEITQRSIELQTGGIDFAFDLGKTDAESLKANADFGIYEAAGACVHNIHFNSSEGHVFANEDLRKAAASAISASDILKGAYDSGGWVANSYVSLAAPGYDTALTSEPWPQDLAKAKEFFAASGVPEGTKIKIIVDDRAYRIASTEIIKNQLAAIGLDATIQQFDFATAFGFAQDVTNDWDIYPLAQCQSTATSQAARLTNAVKYVSYPDTPAGSDLLALINELLGTVDLEKAKDLNNQIQVAVNEHVALYPVVQSQVLHGYNSQLTGVDKGMITSLYLYAKDLAFK